MNTTLTDSTKLYRFISFDALLDHLVNKRVTCFKYKLFDDPWEGFYHKGFHMISEHDSYSVKGENRQFMLCFTKRQISEAMWRIYSRDGRGVQIGTTVGSLNSLISGCGSKFDCYLREVIYDDDIEKDDFFAKNFPKETMHEKIVECLFRKRKAFDHEEEVRLVLCAKDDHPDSDVYSLDCDPTNIIENVTLDPRLDKRMEDLQIGTLHMLGFKGIVTKSKLYTYKRVWYKK